MQCSGCEHLHLLVYYCFAEKSTCLCVIRKRNVFMTLVVDDDNFPIKLTY